MAPDPVSRYNARWLRLYRLGVACDDYAITDVADIVGNGSLRRWTLHRIAPDVRASIWFDALHQLHVGMTVARFPDEG